MKEITSEILALAAKGNPYAIEDLYNLTYNSVYKTAKILIQDEDTVLDIVQDSYIKAFQSLDQLDSPENFRAWIRKIATNKAKDYLKRKKPILFSEMASEDGDEIDFLDERLDHYPELVMDRKETTRLMRQILDTLSEEQRLVIGMFYYEQMSVKEIAETLGCSENTVKSRLNYGRKKVEVQVRELEKRGTRLYSLAPLSFLLCLFSLEASAEEIPSPAVLEGITAKCAGHLAGAKAACAGGRAAAGAGSKALAGKIIAGVLAVAVAGGGAAAAISALSRTQAPAVTESHTAVTLPVQEESGETVPVETGAAETVPAETGAAETVPETLPVLSPEEAYQTIAAEYQAVLSVDSGTFLNTPESYFNADHQAIRYYHMYHAEDFYYAYRDIDGNGMEELLIATGHEGIFHIVDVYGFDGTGPVQLVDEPTLGDRSRLTLMEDGSLYLYGSGGAGSGVHILWRISPDGAGLDTVFEYSFDFSQTYDGIYHGADGSTITEEAFTARMEDYREVTDLAWTLMEITPAEPETGSGDILADILQALTISPEEYDADPEYYENRYRHLGEGVVWMLTHREIDIYTMGIWNTDLDVDGDGQAELCIGRGVAPTRVSPIVIYTRSGEAIYGDALYAYADLFSFDAPVEWNYLGG